jgi:energy-coupling factor transport system permease protein
LNLTSTRQLAKIIVFLVIPTILIIILNWIFVSKELFHIGLMVLRFWGLSWLFNWFLKQVEPDDLAKALWAFHFPYRIAWQISLAYRFLPMFQEESQRIYQIQISRGIPLDRGLLLRLRYLSSISVPLLVMTQDKANLFAEALFARNWNSKTPKSILNPLKMHLRDWFLLSIVLSSLLLLYI